MARVLSVSYDPSLLDMRQILLARKGYLVDSASDISQALELCNNSTQFDLLLLGHSIPNRDKELLIKVFRAKYPAPVLALKRAPFEADVPGADLVIDPDPDVLLRAIAMLLRDKNTTE